KAALEARLRAERDRGQHDTTRLRHLERRLGSALDRALGLARRDLSTRAKLLESYSYQRVLERGFVLVRDARGQTILRAGATHPGMPLSLNFADGRVPARVTGRSEGARPLALKKPTPAQGTLL
ncbi:MAG TPA: exodeoxyribonuclease VII large subunit, partial [Alphaproteobacteria bacterium]|nr:exodeoxyribonuclease VII large subunit [Alphaproteobacteria bacterium]